MDPIVIFHIRVVPSLFAFLHFRITSVFSELALSLCFSFSIHILPKLIVMVSHNYLSNRAHGVEKKHIVFMN